MFLFVQLQFRLINRPYIQFCNSLNVFNHVYYVFDCNFIQLVIHEANCIFCRMDKYKSLNLGIIA